MQIKTVATIKGFYINLDTSVSRKTKVEQNLQKQGLNDWYRRFPAIKATDEEASKKGLNKGELGLWRSWMCIFKGEIKSTEKYSQIHLVEDDAVIGPTFKKFASKLDEAERFDILFTDMHVNAQIYTRVQKRYIYNLINNRIELIPELYTGCTPSCIIPKNKIEKVYSILESKLKDSKCLPIDNTILRASHEKELRVSSTAPFITSIGLEETMDSTIQESTKDLDQQIELSQKINLLLRRKLSTVFIDKTPLKEIIDAIHELLEVRKEIKVDIKEDAALINNLAEYLTKKQVLKYKIHPRLAEEPHNPQ